MISPDQPRSSSQSRALRPVPAAYNASSPTSRPDCHPSPNQGPLITGSDPTKPRAAAELAHDASRQDGSPRLLGGRFLRDSMRPGSRSPSQSPFRLTMPSISPAQLAFSALQYLPVPTLVLNNLKTVVLANEAMGRMLGIVSEDADEEDASATIERLRGQTLSQVGIDMLQDGRPVWVTWEAFLDTLVGEMGVRACTKDPHVQSQPAGDATPTTNSMAGPDRCQNTSPRQTQNAIVEVVVSRKGICRTTFDDRYRTKASEYQVFAKMIITIWELEDRQTFFTLTFTSTQSPPSSLATTKKSVARPSILEAAERRTIAHSNPSSVSSSRDSNSPSFHSPGVVSMSSSPFPPMGPPSVASQSSTPSFLQKMLLMKDALLNNTQMPILAMWKDGSATFPNKAARQFFQKDAPLDASFDGFDLLNHWHMYTEDFSRKLEIEEYPITILLRTEQPFTSLRIGMYDDQGKKVVFDVLGEAIRDDTTGEFLAGVVTGRDVTVMTEEIEQIKERDEERFKLICETMPQLVWTTTPDGTADFFNSRWCNYTGLTPEQSYGRQWIHAFHPDDMPEALSKWERSLSTGDPYMIEYRCRNKDGEWRWFLGRASPLRNMETGVIEKWFGTCTDAHEGIVTKRNAKQTRQQLLSVIAHSHVTLFTVDPNRRVTMLEGALIWNNTHEEHDDTRWFIGENMYTVFNRLTEQLPDGERPAFLEPIEHILNGNLAEDVHEHGLDDRWYRTRFLPMVGKKAEKGTTDESCIEGVIGVIMDVTELRNREEALQKQSQEKRKAIANEAAAKEANRLKSQFLANMSHEIRTPITGVLGMAELLAGMELDLEQQEYVENIQSSATSLLTVINDILDFSKVESGRLDIEEVQFSLSHIVKEVGRMLKFAVERKNLDFRSDIDNDISHNLVVIGDPGRVRQIITNLLTNSIKFTTQGFVRFSVRKEKETAESIEIRFTVEDTGIGIHEDVRKKLFQPFSQGDASTARRFGGTGLGLTICKNLLDLMHGRITLESSNGSGTIATFWIPFNKPNGPAKVDLAQAGAIPDRLQSELSMSCNSSEYEQLSGTPPASESAQGGSSTLPRRPRTSWTSSTTSDQQDLSASERAKIRILVVEDNPINQKIATKTIGRLGFQVNAAWNGKEALDYLLGASKGINPKPDIILMDVQMPIIDGYKCTHLLRHHLPYKTIVQDVPIVAMTASAIQGDREKCTKAGMDDYLPKPVRGVILEKMIIRWCNTRRHGSGPGPMASDCSELSEHCDNAEIPHVGIEANDMPPLGPSIEDMNNNNSPVTPRPLTTNGQQKEPSPFDSPIPDLVPQVRRPDGEQEWSNHLQETKLFDAAGGPTSYRSNSYQEQQRGDSLTEENVNKLKSENQAQQ